MSTSQLSPGTVVDGRFTVGAIVSTRPGATLHEATDRDGTEAWLTYYSKTCFPTDLTFERSLRELKQIQALSNRRIIDVIASGRHEDGLYEATEVLDTTQTLADHDDATSLRDAAIYVAQVGEAVLVAQEAGVIHRNLGAAVVYLTSNGVKVGGFAVGEPHGDAAGPLDTLAPEQADGSVIDERTLVYNLAALMHRVLVGKPLFSGSEDEVLEHHRSTEPADVHPGLLRALAKDPRLRPMILKTFLADLVQQAGVEQPPILGDPASALTGSMSSSGGFSFSMSTGTPPPPTEDEGEQASKPSTRGWTMFMSEDEDDEDEVPAPPPFFGSTPSTSSDREDDETATADKPSTRGWTMFMSDEVDEADEDDESPKSGSKPSSPSNEDSSDSDEPTSASKSTSDSSPTVGREPEGQGSAARVEIETTTETPASTEKPSTRGWTMFMSEDEDDEDDDEPELSPPPIAPAPVATPKPSASDEQPRTRGWTMFMEDENSEELSLSPQAATTKPKPTDEREWTIFSEGPPPDRDEDIKSEAGSDESGTAEASEDPEPASDSEPLATEDEASQFKATSSDDKAEAPDLTANESSVSDRVPDESLEATKTDEDTGSAQPATAAPTTVASDSEPEAEPPVAEDPVEKGSDTAPKSELGAGSPDKTEADAVRAEAEASVEVASPVRVQPEQTGPTAKLVLESPPTSQADESSPAAAPTDEPSAPVAVPGRSKRGWTKMMNGPLPKAPPPPDPVVDPIPDEDEPIVDEGDQTLVRSKNSLVVPPLGETPETEETRKTVVAVRAATPVSAPVEALPESVPPVSPTSDAPIAARPRTVSSPSQAAPPSRPRTVIASTTTLAPPSAAPGPVQPSAGGTMPPTQPDPVSPNRGPGLTHEPQRATPAESKPAANGQPGVSTKTYLYIAVAAVVLIVVVIAVSFR